MRILVALLTLALTACASSASGNRPATFVQSTAESRTTRVIDIRDGFTRATVMRALTDALAQRFTVEVTDARAGFAMTSWEASLVRDGVPDLRYRTRFVAQFVGDDWRRLHLRHEANWSRGDEWDIGFDAAQLDSVSNELRAKLGRRP
jgi:hypothetical protein